VELFFLLPHPRFDKIAFNNSQCDINHRDYSGLLFVLSNKVKKKRIYY
jgi:hypothetical protein